MTVATYDPFNPAVIADPYPHYARLRAESPVHYLETYGLWCVSRYDDVAAILRNHGTFSSELGMGDFMDGRFTPPEETRVTFREPGRMLIASDPPDHTRLRRLAAKPFGRPAVAALEPRIREICEQLVDDLVTANEHGDADLVRDLAYPLPVIVISELLGIPPERRDDFKRWSDDAVIGLTASADLGGVQRTVLEMRNFFYEVIEQRRREPGKDVISILVQAGGDEHDPLTPAEIVQFCQLLLIAGNETTTNLISNGMRALFDYSETERHLREDPGLIPQAIEEMLRYDSPVQSLFRGTREETELGGVRLPEGARLMVLFGSANRDESHYPNSDEFLIDRNPTDHLAFGSGIHFCLGGPLARLEAKVAFETLLRRARSLEPASDPVPVDSFLLRGSAQMPVSFELS